jgi:hypothetical protein
LTLVREAFLPERAIAKPKKKRHQRSGREAALVKNIYIYIKEGPTTAYCSFDVRAGSKRAKQSFELLHGG